MSFARGAVSLGAAVGLGVMTGWLAFDCVSRFSELTESERGIP